MRDVNNAICCVPLAWEELKKKYNLRDVVVLSGHCDLAQSALVKSPKAAFASCKKDFEPILTCIT